MRALFAAAMVLAIAIVGLGSWFMSPAPPGPRITTGVSYTASHVEARRGARPGP
ncbi:MAG: hypothetical protein QOI47_1765, partial [Actinomycetota bacterium]|nr:hypothetical protein [Actinomycetota bacterium]